MSGIEDIEHFIHHNGSIPISDMFDIVKKVSLEDFKKLCPFPFLVSSDIKKGILEDFAASKNSTLNFDPSDTNSSLFHPSDEITNLPIFPLVKFTSNNKNKVSFSIGRHFENDLAIADYTISRKHGIIQYEMGEYQYKALKSMNGSFINNKLIYPNEIDDLPFQSKLGIGRYVFVLTSSEDLYIKLS